MADFAGAILDNRYLIWPFWRKSYRCSLADKASDLISDVAKVVGSKPTMRILKKKSVGSSSRTNCHTRDDPQNACERKSAKRGTATDHHERSARETRTRARGTACGAAFEHAHPPITFKWVMKYFPLNLRLLRYESVCIMSGKWRFVGH